MSSTDVVVDLRKSQIFTIDGKEMKFHGYANIPPSHRRDLQLAEDVDVILVEDLNPTDDNRFMISIGVGGSSEKQVEASRGCLPDLGAWGSTEEEAITRFVHNAWKYKCMLEQSNKPNQVN